MVRTPRPAARLLMLDPQGALLLFRFTPEDRPPFWATPGGACDPGENHDDAARREMAEETGWQLDPGPVVATRHAEFMTFDGQAVWSDERYYLVRVPERRIDIANHTELEQRVMQHHKWWSLDELRETKEQIFPENIADMLMELRV